MLGLLYALLGLALAVIVWPAEEPRAFSGLAGSEWRVIEIAGARAQGTSSVRFTHTSVRGRATCNAFFGSFRETQGAVEISGINHTRMGCDAHAEEQAFIDSLARVRSYRIDGDKLVLIDGGGSVVLKLSG